MSLEKQSTAHNDVKLQNNEQNKREEKDCIHGWEKEEPTRG